MGFHYSDDPIRDFERHDAEQTAWLESLPKCEYCGKPIQDEHYYDIEDCLIHEDCLHDFCYENYRKPNNNI